MNLQFDRNVSFLNAERLNVQHFIINLEYRIFLVRIILKHIYCSVRKRVCFEKIQFQSAFSSGRNSSDGKVAS